MSFNLSKLPYFGCFLLRGFSRFSFFLPLCPMVPRKPIEYIMHQAIYIYIYIYIYRVSINSFPDYKHLLQENYLDMLEHYVAPQLEEFQPWIIFQQDGALPLWVSDVRRCLEAKFPNRWIGRDGPAPWPPRSPNITPLELFLWGHVKDKVFSTPVPDITNLKARITEAFATITEDILENTWREIDYRLDVLRATKGAHVDVY